MKVIGKARAKHYICEVTHDEIEKYLNLYYGNKNELSIGDEVDMGQGYNWADKIKDAVSKMSDLIDKADQVTSALKMGRVFVGRMKKEGEK